MNKRLANVKTKEETGLNYVVSKLSLFTPFGMKALKSLNTFFPGMEGLLEKEFDKIEIMSKFISDEEELLEELKRKAFHDMKDLLFSVERSKDNTLSMVELFELKGLLLQMEEISKVFSKAKTEIPSDFILAETEDLLNELDPRRDRLNTFYIYEEFSEILVLLRNKKKELEGKLRKEQKEKRDEVKEKYGVVLTPKFDYTVSKSDTDEVEKLGMIEELEISDQDYMSVTFTLSIGEGARKIKKDIENINEELEEEEERIRRNLSKKIWSYEKSITENCERIGRLDLTLGKASYAVRHNCVRPKVTTEHIIEISEGRHLKVEDILRSKNKEYMPVSIELRQGVTCITGANMGGKTISLKLVGLVAILVQNGFFVPCKKATVGLSNYMQMLIGDSQSVERGLSSFGSEMEELKEILDKSKDRSLLLIDEIASGTNPIEGLALTKGIIDYLKKKNYISLITTHFDAVSEDKEVKNMQVLGLAKADFETLDREIKYANRKERIGIIAKNMDYRLYEVKGKNQVPKDAVNIAKMLGIGEEIINATKKYIN